MPLVSLFNDVNRFDLNLQGSAVYRDTVRLFKLYYKDYNNADVSALIMEASAEAIEIARADRRREARDAQNRVNNPQDFINIPPLPREVNVAFNWDAIPAAQNAWWNAPAVANQAPVPPAPPPPWALDPPMPVDDAEDVVF